MNKSTALIEVSPAQAATAGLPAVQVRVTETALPLMARPLPFGGAYLSLSGPPGGPLGMTVTADVARPEEMADSLRDAGHQDVQSSLITWNGESLPAIASRHGEGNARAQELRVMATTVNEKGIWITISAAPPTRSLTPAQLAAQAPFAEMLAAVKVGPP